jgi:hypothetical protein
MPRYTRTGAEQEKPMIRSGSAALPSAADWFASDQAVTHGPSAASGTPLGNAAEGALS